MNSDNYVERTGGQFVGFILMCLNVQIHRLFSCVNNTAYMYSAIIIYLLYY